MSGSKSNAGQRATPAANLVFAWVTALVVVVAVAFAPGSGIGPQTLVDWHDQQVFLKAATDTIAQGLPDAETQSLVGPAYVGLTLVVGAVFNLSPDAALILLSRMTFVACMAILALTTLRDRAQAEPRLQLAFLGVAVLSLLTSVWFRVLDIPWTHFVASALLGGMLLVSLTRLPLALRAALIGLLAVLLVQTRLFEAMVALIAAVLIVPLAIWRHREAWGRPAATLGRSVVQMVLPALGGGAMAFVAIGLASHNWSIYQQYGGQVAMVIRPELAPVKAVQLFWDTCFATLCQFAQSLPVSPLADSLDSWRQPLLLQLPGLAAAAAGLLVFLAMRPRRVLQLPLGVVFAILAAGGTILAYLSGAPSGSSHLKYGFFRDFVAPMILITGAFIAALAMRERSERPEPGLAVPFAVYFLVLIGLVALRAFGLPGLPVAQPSQFQIASLCEAGQCRFTLAATDAAGKGVPYNDLAYVTCGDKPLTPAVRPLSQLQVEAATCPRIGIIPVAAGVLYTPEDEVFRTPGLDLTRPADSLTVPPKA